MAQWPMPRKPQDDYPRPMEAKAMARRVLSSVDGLYAFHIGIDIDRRLSEII
jgi:hypothetical protein